MSLKCACNFEECYITEGEDGFLYSLDGGVTYCTKETYYSAPQNAGRIVQIDDYINWDEQDKQVAESGFLRKPRKDEVYIKFTQDITPLERLTVHAVIFNALAMAFPNSHIGKYEE